MRTIIAILCFSFLCGCASNPELTELERYKQARIEIVAKDLVKEGKAVDMNEARARAKLIVEKEISDQQDSMGINMNRERENQLNVNSRVDD